MSVAVARSFTQSMRSRPFPTPPQWMLLPNGARVQGCNLNPFTDVTVGSLVNWWTNWPWSTYIQPQIDAIAGSRRFNAVRFMFSTACRYPGSGENQLSTALLLQRTCQLLDYCRKKGLYVQPTLGCDSGAFDYWAGGPPSYTPPLSWFVQEFSLLVSYLLLHADIIYAIDCYNEAHTWASGTEGGYSQARAVVIYETLKEIAPQFSIGWSADQYVPTVPAAGSYDHIDVHVYTAPSNIPPTYYDTYLSSFGVPINIAEWGVEVSAGTTARQALANAVSAAVANVTSGRKLAGQQIWNAVDQPGLTTYYGAFNNTAIPFTERADIAGILDTMPA